MKRGFSDIGYHYIIHPDGTYDEGRPLTLEGAHCLNYNRNSVGICYIGGMSADGKHYENTMTAEQEETMIRLVGTLMKTQKLTHTAVHGHNEF